MTRKYVVREWDGSDLEADHMTFMIDNLGVAFLNMVREDENGRVVKSKLYLAYGVVVEDTDHDKTVAEVIQKEEEMIQLGMDLFKDHMDNMTTDRAEPDMGKVLQSYG